MKFTSYKELEDLYYHGVPIWFRGRKLRIRAVWEKGVVCRDDSETDEFKAIVPNILEGAADLSEIRAVV